jgi:hypothetical protein
MRHGNEDARGHDDRDQPCERGGRSPSLSGCLISHDLDDDALAERGTSVLSAFREVSASQAGMLQVAAIPRREKYFWWYSSASQNFPAGTISVTIGRR